MSVYRIYVEKKPEFAVEAQSVLNDLQTALRLSVTGVRILNRYDADHLTEEAFQKAIPTVFSEPAVDVTYDTLPECTGNQRMFAVEYLPGQFDQRADSCEQCIQILLQGERCRVRTAQIYIISGNMTDAEFQQIQSYLINPVERRKASSTSRKRSIPTMKFRPKSRPCTDSVTAPRNSWMHSFGNTVWQWIWMTSSSVRIISRIPNTVTQPSRKSG